MSDTVPLRAGQTNPIKLGIVHPALVRYQKQSDANSFLVRWQKRVWSVPVATAHRRTRPDQTGEAQTSALARKSKRRSSCSLTTAVGRANEEKSRYRTRTLIQETLEKGWARKQTELRAVSKNRPINKNLFLGFKAQGGRVLRAT